MASFQHQKVAVLYHGGQHSSLGIFGDYVEGIRSAFSDSLVIDYFARTLDLGTERCEASICAEVEQHGSSLVFFLPGSGDLTLSAYLFERLAARAVLVMNFFDSELFFERIDRHYAQVADLVLVPCPSSVGLFASVGVRACCTFSLFDPKRYHDSGEQPSIDVSFVGNLLKRGRREYLETLRAAGMKVEAAGYGTPAGIISHAQMIELFNRSRINLNFCDAEEPERLLYATPGKIPTRQLKGRITEIAMTGGFVLTEYAPGLEEMFEVGREVAVFHNAGELVEQVRRYCRNEAERRAVAAAGQARALRDYDCRSAFSRLSEVIPEQGRHATLVPDPEFLRDQAGYRLYYAVRFLLAFRPFKALAEFRQLAARGYPDLRAVLYLAVRAVAAGLRRYRLTAVCYDALKELLLARRGY